MEFGRRFQRIYRKIELTSRTKTPKNLERKLESDTLPVKNSCL